MPDPSTVQFYVDDTSPTISYYPFADTLTVPSLQSGWNPYYSISGFATAAGESGNGTSFHITALNGASLSLSFNGTGIQLIGNATNASYSLTLDGSLTQPNSSSRTDNILASFQDLPNAPHSLLLTTITSPASSFIAFDKALITAPPPNQNVSIASTFPTQVYPDDSISFLGKWSFADNYINTNTSFHQSTTAGDRAHLSFTGTSLFLTGLTSPDCGQYSVTIDNDTTTTKTLSAHSSFIHTDTLLFFASGLDPQVSHYLEVQNVDGNVLALKLGGVGVVTQGPGNTPPNSTWCPEPTNPTAYRHSGVYPRGTIAALILGGVLVVLIFAASLYYYMNWRTRGIYRRRGNREVTSKLARDGMVLDIRGSTATDALGAVQLPTALDTDTEKIEVHDLSRLSPIEAIGSVKSESKSSDGWVGHILTRSRSKAKCKCKGKCKGNCQDHGRSQSLSQSQHSSPGTGTSFTIDLQLTPPRRSSQALPRSRSGSRSDPISLPSLSKLPSIQRTPSKAKADDRAAPGTQPGVPDSLHNNSGSSYSSAPFIPSRSSSPMPPPHKHPNLPNQERRGSRSLLHTGLPKLELPHSENSSIEYIDVAPDPSNGDVEYEVDGIRGLSPRTSEVARRKTQPAVAAGPLLVDISEQKPEELKEVQEVATEASPDEEQRVTEEDFLNSINTSPFRVDFVERLHSLSGKSGSSHVRFQEDLEEFGQRPRESVPQVNREPNSALQRSSARISFLDFGATSSSSLLTESSSSISQPNPNVSRWSSTTAPSTLGSHDPHHTGSTPSFPFPLSMPPPQSQPPIPSNQNRASLNQPQQGSPRLGHQLLQLPVGRHPQSDLDFAPSPTDSVPMSVSDILFRQSVSDDGSRRASTGSRLLPPHPPLPGLPPVGESDQSRRGSPSPDVLGRISNPLANSSFIVQRVLGVNVPVLGSPISHDHVRSGSTSNSVMGPR